LIDDLHEEFYSIYSEERDISISDHIRVLRERLRKISNNVCLNGVKCVTFFTNGLPWGYAFNEVPSTHVLTNRNIIGPYLINAIASERQGIRVCLLIDPGQDEHAEVENIRELLVKNHVFVRVLNDKTASVLNAELNIIHYPYDLLIISTHASDMEGIRVTYKYADRHGKEREFVIDEGVGFAVKRKSEKVKVTEFMRFISLDGVPWYDSEGKKQIDAGQALQDFINLKTADQRKISTIKREKRNRIQGSMALKMSDGNMLIALHSIGYKTSPIIFNNACCSWHELASRFIYAGARSYIGTLIPVTDVEATEVAKAVFINHLEKPLSTAIWHAQNDTYGEDKRHPYAVIGLHFTTINFNTNNQIDIPTYIARSLIESHKAWTIKAADESVNGEVRENAREYSEFLANELKNHLRRWI
jgi:hypothetical protein